MKLPFFKGVVLGSVISLAVLMTTAAFAGTGVGAIFNLGKYNVVNGSTGLAGSTNGTQLSVVNTSPGSGATGIGVYTAHGRPPFVVNSAAKVANLNADLLDGVHANALQARVSGTCTNGTAIVAIAANGSATCTRTAIYPIHFSVIAGQDTLEGYQPSSLAIDFACNIADNLAVFFVENQSGTDGTLNWFFSQGGTTSTVNAEGQGIAAHTNLEFDLSGARLEGQFIWEDQHDAVTINLHAASGTVCDYAGTAEVAHTP